MHAYRFTTVFKQKADIIFCAKLTPILLRIIFARGSWSLAVTQRQKGSFLWNCLWYPSPEAPQSGIISQAVSVSDWLYLGISGRTFSLHYLDFGLYWFVCRLCSFQPQWVDEYVQMICLSTVLSGGASAPGCFTPGGGSRRSSRKRCFLSGWYVNCRWKLCCGAPRWW